MPSTLMTAGFLAIRKNHPKGPLPAFHVRITSEGAPNACNVAKKLWLRVLNILCSMLGR